MWRIKTISAENFMSFESLNYEFEDNCYVVRAENKDNDGQQSNGGGKTSFVDIIAVALLGYSLTGRNVKDCVNWATDKGYFAVSLSMENTEHKKTCEIRRKIYSNTKSGELVLLVNGEVPTTLPTKRGIENGVDVKAGDAYILEGVLDLNADDLLNYYLISGKYYQPFLKVNTDKKLDVINRFSKAHVVDKAIKKLELEQEVKKDGVEEYKLWISKLTGYIEALTDSMSGEAETIWKTNQTNRVLQLEKDCNLIEAQLLNLEKGIDQVKLEIDSLVSKLVIENPEYVAAANSQMEDSKKELANIVKKRRELEKQEGHIENYLAGLITCPGCGNKFSLSGEKHSKTELIHLQTEIVQQLEDEKETTDFILSIKEVVEKANKVVRENDEIKQDIRFKEKQIENIKEQQDRLLKQFESTLDQTAKEKEKTFADEQLHIREQIKEKEAERKEQDRQLSLSFDELDEINLWVKYFEDFKFYLGNKPIELICGLVNQYLKLNGSDLNLHIEGFKKLKSGEIRQALQPIIYRNGDNPKDYNQFSEGEKTRLNLSVDLSFQQLINSSSKYGGLDLYVNDELCNPLDSLGIQSAATAFDQLGKTILLVSHSGADLVYDNTILITKENQISCVG